METFVEYTHYLRFNPKAEHEWEEAVELLTPHETYFFRESQKLHSFKEEVLPQLAIAANARGRLNIWSAGCSTGEEVYTLAILIRESGLFSDVRVRIYGSDISRRCIAFARQGVYGEAAFRATPPDVKRAYFVPHEDGEHVAEPIRGLCQFGQRNLLDEDIARTFGRQDVIFCRNVLIYLDDHSRKRIIEIFHERLYTGGILVLGHSESLLHVSNAFELFHLKDDLVYRKPRRPSSEVGKFE